MRRIGTVCLLFIALVMLPGWAPADVVTVDFSTDEGPATHRASGFLHAMSATVPSADLVKPLKPKLFRMAAEDWHHDGRGALANHVRVKDMGARMQIVVSDSHGYSLSQWWPGDDGNWKPWEDIVEGIVKRVQANTMTVEYDIWNEPDIGYFWQRDRARLLETWKHGYEKIRSLDSKAVIVGPSLARFDKDYLQEFLLYAKANKVVPDVLSWHEMGSYKNLPAHADAMRTFLAENGIKIERFCINEWIGARQQTMPGYAVRFFASGERAKIDGACHACWGDAEPKCSNCENMSLDGILTHLDKRPRSTWWAYKAYADVTGQLVKVTPTKEVDGVAGKDPKAKTARVVLGRDGGSAGDVQVRFENMRAVEYLVSSGKVHVKAERIPDSGWSALEKPVVELDTDATTKDGSLTITLPNFGPADAYLVIFTRPAAE